MVALSSKKKQPRKLSRIVQGVIIFLFGIIMISVLGSSKEEIDNVETNTKGNTLLSMGHWNWKTLVQKQSGDGWNLWNDTAPILTEFTQYSKCRWTTFRATNGQTAQMCVHWGDAVSRAIVKRGRWVDCDILTTQFEEANPNKKHRIYMDVGANIGACVLQMLFTTEAPVIAFEPEPINLFCLTNTILRLEPRYRDRFLLFPFALSDTPGSKQMQAQVGDMGNAFLGDIKPGAKEKNEEEEEKYRRSVQVPVENLDSIITVPKENPEDIALMKLHAQGHECKVFDGMPKLLPHIKAVHTEIYKTSLELQGCSADDFLKRLETVGFEIQHKDKVLLDEEQQGKSEVLALNKKMN